MGEELKKQALKEELGKIEQSLGQLDRSLSSIKNYVILNVDKDFFAEKQYVPTEKKSNSNWKEKFFWLTVGGWIMFFILFVASYFI